MTRHDATSTRPSTSIAATFVPSLLLGDLHAAQGQDEAALEAWKRIENQDPVYLALVAERVMDAYGRLGRVEQGHQLLRAWLAGHASLDLLDELFHWELEREGPKAAYELVREELRRNPTLLGLDKLLEAAVLAAPAEQRSDIELIKQLIHGHTRRVARYRCEACGFKARQFHWRCPACGGWETYPRGVPKSSTSRLERRMWDSVSAPRARRLIHVTLHPC